ncbi:phosphonate C-P lyase system protein PhnH [Marinimicrococcus flavescens]|uniref:Phosphonate C-P lyase system protein PhnH n=1 Tax=Marinimicrococcus flavescens TaxID=3031815 RepID=A0AAP3UZ25_9PROT|nr:phosphonate C-P lyase system protein PhnH [Marinimicrococcus flavescens]
MAALGTDAAIAEGFADPVTASQEHFRHLLDALSRPGRIVELGAGLPAAPAPLSRGSYALLLSLLDYETPLWLAEAGEAAASLRFHCGCPVTECTGDAVFAVAPGGAAPALEEFAQGTPDYPDRSTTLLLEVEALGEGGQELVLRGPGIEESAVLRVGGLDAGLVGQLRANHRSFPQGVDIVLVAGSRIAGLPRTTEVEIR